MSSKPIALILGSGGNIGAGVARHFANAGYQIAVVSRNAGDPPAKDSDGYLSINGDLGDISVYASIYSQIQEYLGGVPSVVVYNAASLNHPTEPDNIFSVSPDKFKQDLDVGTHGPYTAAGDVFKLWAASNDGRKKTFIYTGNLLAKRVLAVAALVTLGIHKNASHYWLALADTLYKDKGIRFFFTDQRTPEGNPVGLKPDADAHGEMYVRLSQHPESYPTYVSFVDGTKLVEFPV